MFLRNFVYRCMIPLFCGIGKEFFNRRAAKSAPSNQRSEEKHGIEYASSQVTATDFVNEPSFNGVTRRLA